MSKRYGLRVVAVGLLLCPLGGCGFATSVEADVAAACADYGKALPDINDGLQLAAAVGVAVPEAATIAESVGIVTGQFLTPFCSNQQNAVDSSAAWVKTNLANVQADLAKVRTAAGVK